MTKYRDPRLPLHHCKLHARYDRTCEPCRKARGAHERMRDGLAGIGKPSLVDVIHARRRLSALMALGWPIGWLAPELDMTEGGLRDLFSGPQLRTTRETDRRIRELYDRLWNVTPVAHTPSERMVVSRTRARAQMLGYDVPLAWDDSELDAPLALQESA